MKVGMDYPRDSRYNGFDGNTHNIEPVGLYGAQVNEKELFLMVYRDISMGNISMITILEEHNGNFRKVPLSNYDSEEFDRLMNYIKEYGRRISIEQLPNHIETRRTPISVEELVQEKPEKKPTKPNTMGAAAAPPPPPGPPGPPIGGGSPPPPPPPTPPKYNIGTTKPQKTKENNGIMSFVYYNMDDGKYYWDKECTHRIINAPASLGIIEGSVIHGPNCEYYIRYISKGHEIKYTSGKEHTINYGKVYYDGKKYYWDKNCERKILGAPKSIGVQESQKVINGYNGTKYQIVNVVKIYYNDGDYFYDIECTNPLPFEIESLGRIVENIIEDTDDNMYLIVNVQKKKDNSNGGFRR